MEKLLEYYNWGNNCRLLRLDTDAAQMAIEAFFPTYPINADPALFDEFWDGYYNGKNTEIVSLSQIGL